MNSSSNPLIRPGNPFERRLVDAVDRAKPGRSVGILNKPLPGGTSQTIEAKQRASAVVHPFFIYTTGKMHAGTVNGIIPTLGGSPIGESGNSLTMSGNKYVYIKNEWTLTFTSGFLTAAVRTASTIVTSTSVLADAQTGTSFISYRLVAQLIDGVVQRAQQTTTNMLNLVCDQSDGSSETGSVSSTWTTS